MSGTFLLHRIKEEQKGTGKGSSGDSKGRGTVKEADAVCSEKDRKGLERDNGDRKDNQNQLLK